VYERLAAGSLLRSLYSRNYYFCGQTRQRLLCYTYGEYVIIVRSRRRFVLMMFRSSEMSETTNGPLLLNTMSIRMRRTDRRPERKRYYDRRRPSQTCSVIVRIAYKRTRRTQFIHTRRYRRLIRHVRRCRYRVKVLRDRRCVFMQTNRSETTTSDANGTNDGVIKYTSNSSRRNRL